MLTVDLVRTRIKGGELTLLGINPKARGRVLATVEQLLALTEAAAADQATRAEHLAALEEVEIAASERRIVEGLKKLILDRCDFKAAVEDPAPLRAHLFLKAAAIRRALPPEVPFDRGAVLAEAASELGLSPEALDGALYADLKENHHLRRFKTISAEALLARYDLALKQAALLKAIHVIVHIESDDPGALREVFRALKFNRLLYRITREGAGYLLEIDGPHSLFEQVTKYGFQLAMFLPTLALCTRWALRAELRWGKQKLPLILKLEGGASDIDGLRAPPARLPDEVEQLLDRFKKLASPWRVQRSTRILDLPGVGVCVPDLVFSQGDAEGTTTRVYLEVLGYWSREAVWRRVDLIHAGLPEPVIFAVSDRLRVGEGVVEPEALGALYVYRGAINAKAILTRLEQLRGHD
ncbi:DUF790 family protein [Myxococcota bacterium]|nr:DUF790 family protein [Myxococcota bacterium]